MVFVPNQLMGQFDEKSFIVFCLLLGYGVSVGPDSDYDRTRNGLTAIPL